MRIANDTYHVRTYVRHTYVRTNVPTPPALCLGTPVPRQKPWKAKLGKPPNENWRW